MGIRIGLVLVRGVVWGVVGALYAAFFTTLWRVFDANGMGDSGFLLAAALAGIAGAAVYGAMQLTIIGTITGIVSSTVYMLAATGPVSLMNVAVISAVAGAVLGILIRLPKQFARRAQVTSVNGLVAGAVAGGLVLLFRLLFPEFAVLSVVSGLLVIATGFIYVASLQWWLKGLRSRYAQIIIIPLGSALISGLVGGGVWILGGPVVTIVTTQYGELLAGIVAQLHFALIGGALAGAVAGAMLELFGFRSSLDRD